MTLTAPVVEITFRDIADAVIAQRGRTVALILDAAASTSPSTNPLIVKSAADIPANIAAGNRTQIENTLIGGVYMPEKVICYFRTNTDNYDDAKTALERERWDWLAIPAIADENVDDIVAWLETMRENYQNVKAVLPNAAADKPFVVNFTTEDIAVDRTTYTAAQYCSRIAGILAGTPLSQSATYVTLPEVSGVELLSRTERDAAVGAGNLILFYDGEKVKTSRAVNSLTGADDDMKKIKIIEIIDAIKSQVSKKIEDDFIGKYVNNYDNKCVLLAAMTTYFDSLAAAGVISPGYETGLDVAEQAKYLESKGIDTVGMTEQEILEADTDTSVFLYAKIAIPDAIEDVYIAIQR